MSDRPCLDVDVCRGERDVWFCIAEDLREERDVARAQAAARKDAGAGLSDPELREYAGAYEMCALLLTSPVFNKPQREVIEQQAYRVKDKLEALGVKFEGQS